jgi:diguanylate cyclase (GGDEF)-like protein
MITIEKDGNSISASVSIGIATYPLNGTSVNELISWADRALYAAKDKGRNQVVLASSVSRSPINKGK